MVNNGFRGEVSWSVNHQYRRERHRLIGKQNFGFFSDAPLTLRIAERNEALLDLYKDYCSDSCAFVTACNPLGQLYDESENARLQDQLAIELKFRSLNFIAGEGKHPVGDWLGEPSFLVFGLSLEPLEPSERCSIKTLSFGAAEMLSPSSFC